MPEPQAPNGAGVGQHPLVVALQERINRAYNEGNEINRALLPGEQPYVPPMDQHQLTAGFNTLLTLLIEAEIVSTEDFAIQKGMAWAALAEQWIEAVREHRKKNTGLLGPNGVPV